MQQKLKEVLTTKMESRPSKKEHFDLLQGIMEKVQEIERTEGSLLFRNHLAISPQRLFSSSYCLIPPILSTKYDSITDSEINPVS